MIIKTYIWNNDKNIFDGVLLLNSNYMAYFLKHIN